MSLLLDLRRGLRHIRRQPFLTAITTLTLALGIGANTALFHAFLFALAPRLPYQQPDRIAIPCLKSITAPNSIGYSQFSVPDLLDWRAMSRSFSAIAASTYLEEMNLGGNQAERIHSVKVTANIFDVLGLHALLGRSFRLDEETATSAQVVILSHTFWRGHLGSDPSVLGKTVKLNGEPYWVIGVMPSDFRLVGLPQFDLLLPLKINSPFALDRIEHSQMREAATNTLSAAANHTSDAGRIANLTRLEIPVSGCTASTGTVAKPRHSERAEHRATGSAREPLVSFRA